MLCSLSELGLTVHDFPYAIEDGIFILGDDCEKTPGMDIHEAVSYTHLEQIRTIDKRRLKERMGRLDDQSMSRINQALSVSFGLPGMEEMR